MVRLDAAMLLNAGMAGLDPMDGDLGLSPTLDSDAWTHAYSPARDCWRCRNKLVYGDWYRIRPRPEFPSSCGDQNKIPDRVEIQVRLNAWAIPFSTNGGMRGHKSRCNELVTSCFADDQNRLWLHPYRRRIRSRLSHT
ncbi:unnamed protein product [Mortierella alpina]